MCTQLPVPKTQLTHSLANGTSDLLFLCMGIFTAFTMFINLFLKNLLFVVFEIIGSVTVT